MKIILKIDRFLERIEKVICVILLLGMLVLGTIQIFGRYFFGFAPAWTEELMCFCQIYLGFIAVVLTIRTDGHIGVDLLLESLKNNKTRKILYTLSRILCMLFLVSIIPAGFQLVAKSTKSLAITLPFSYSYVYIAVPVGCIMMLIAFAAVLPDFAAKVGRGEK